MPEFTESEIISDHNGKSSANESATANESAASSQNSNRPRRQRRRNPILSNVKGKTVAAAAIGPCEVHCQCANDSIGEKKECGCISHDSKYSTQIVQDSEDSRDGKSSQFRRKSNPRVNANNEERSAVAKNADSASGNRCCCCQSFVRKVWNILWPFGKCEKSAENANGNGAHRPSGNNRRPRSGGSAQRNNGNSRGGSSRRSNHPRG